MAVITRKPKLVIPGGCAIELAGIIRLNGFYDQEIIDEGEMIKGR
jgi:hypothetical protein